jgi:7-carboxy-7-deazaguanine synthase
MSYAVKEIFYSLQGEGVNSGRPAVFCRFAGCNLWSGRESDRPRAICKFCDTDFVGGVKHPDAGSIVRSVEATLPPGADWQSRMLVVLTGGEPALQADARLVDALHARGFEVAIETNGTLPLAAGIDHVCVSPKSGAGLVVTSGHELKLVFPQAGDAPSL